MASLFEAIGNIEEIILYIIFTHLQQCCVLFSVVSTIMEKAVKLVYISICGVSLCHLQANFVSALCYQLNILLVPVLDII